MDDSFRECQRELVRLQEGVVTRGQALAAGLTPKAIEARLRRGHWQPIHPGVYATFTGEPGRPAMLWAAVLRAGKHAVLSHQTAAELHGLADVAAPLIHVTVPSGSQVTRPLGVAVHYSRRLALSRHPALSPPRTRVEDTVLDLADGASSADEAIGLALRAIGRRRTTAQLRAATLRGRSRSRWRAGVLAALDPAAQGAHSLLEYRYGVRVEQPHGLPRGMRQRRVRRDGHHEYQDVTYDEYLTVVELDGGAAHPSGESWRDRRRDNVNAAHGLVTLRLCWADVSEQPCATAALVGATLQRRGWRGRPTPCGPTCTLPRAI